MMDPDARELANILLSPFALKYDETVSAIDDEGGHVIPVDGDERLDDPEEA
jgi:hypothetical protein